ncbi:MAG: hypothetical protein KAT79_02790 [candidate division Zixibacteria bacterium]|nr:hypothetical protein [candidate division Zixibacteria bacterium]
MPDIDQMKKSRASLFVIHTPFQRLIVHHMVRSMPEFCESDNYLVLDMDTAGLKIENELWKKVIPLKPPVGRYRLGWGGDCRRACRIVTDILKEYESGSLFITDVLWPLGNALYGLMRKQTDRCYLLCNFPDGFGNLFLKYPSLKRKIRNLIKVCVGMAGGLPYYILRGDIAGIEDSDKVYSLLPSAMPDTIEAEIVGIPKLQISESNVVPQSALFLGQPYDYVMSDEDYHDLATRAADYAAGLGYENLFYKSHHFAKSDIEKDIFANRGFEILDDRRPIEEVFLARQMSCVLSYNSSALVNLKILMGDQIRCISTFNALATSYTVEGKEAYDETLRVFQLCDIEMVD